MSKMSWRSLMAIAMLVGVLAPAVGRTAAPAVRSSVRFPDGVDKVTVPCKRSGGFMFVRGKIDNRDAGWMMIDTGATISILDKAVAKRLGLPARRSMTLSAMGGSVSSAMCGVKSVSLGDISFAIEEVGAFDLKLMQKVMGDRVVGFIGGSVLKQAPFTLDYRKETITFHRPGAFGPPKGAVAHEITIPKIQQSPIARISIAGGYTPKLLLDTGAGSSISLVGEYLRKHPELTAARPAESFRFVSPAGVFEKCGVPLANLRKFGKDDLKLRLGFSSNSSWAAPFAVGVMGNGVLRNFEVTFDYAGGKFWTRYAPLETVAQMLKRKGDVNAAEFCGKTPLMRAGRIEEVRTLLKRGAKVNARTISKCSPLLYAVEKSPEIVTLLLDHGADIKARTHSDACVLSGASSCGTPEIVKLLLKAGAPVNLTNELGVTCLMLAALRGDAAICKILIDAKADVKAADNSGRTALMRAMFLGDKKTVELLLTSGADLNRTDKSGKTPLMFAAEGWNPDIIDLLIARGAKPSTLAGGGETALYYATASGNRHALDRLVKHGADITATSPVGASLLHVAVASEYTDMARYLMGKPHLSIKAKTLSGGTPLHFAASSKNPETVRMLLDAGAAVDAVNSNRMTPLMFAANFACSQNIRILLKAGANVNTVSNAEKLTALHLAASKGHADTVELLLDAKANIEAENQYGQRALHIAALKGHVNIVKLLLARGAKVNRTNDFGVTPLETAKFKGHAEIVKMLQAAGAKTKDEQAGKKLSQALLAGNTKEAQKLINAKTNLHVSNTAGVTPLALAAEKGNIEAVKSLLAAGARPNAIRNNTSLPLFKALAKKQFEIAYLLLDAGADPNAATNNKSTPLCYAAENGNAKLVKALLKAGANVNLPGADGNPPLHRALRRKHLDIAKILLDAGAGVETENKYGVTPLAFAVLLGDEKSTAMLLAKKANPNAYDDLGMTPLAWAKKKGLDKIAKMLTDAGAKPPDKTAGRKILKLMDAGKFDECTPLIKRGVFLEVHNADGSTPLMISATAGRLKTVKALLSAGAKPNSRRDSNGHGALHQAALTGKLEIVKTLLRAGANPDVQNINGVTPMMIAALRGKSLIVNVLLAGGAERGMVSKDGTNALRLAINKCSVTTLEVLATDNPALNAPNPRGYTPLMTACILGRIDAVRALLSAGANPKAKTPHGASIRDLIDAENKDILELLKSAAN